MPGHWLLVLITAGVLVLASDLRVAPEPGTPAVITGPYALLLGASTDLGPADSGPVQFTLTLQDADRPAKLFGWAAEQGLSVRWRPGNHWAVVEGAPNAVADALDVDIHDYRGRRGQEFYASPQQPVVPESLQTEVTEFGRILGYTPHYMSSPAMFPPIPTDVPSEGLTPSALLRTYNAEGLAQQGYTGKGTTIVVFAFDGFDQADLDMFTELSDLPPLNPIVVGGVPEEARGEATMDLQVAHAIAPDAQKVLVNALPTVGTDGGYEKIGQMLEATDRQFPGAIWSFSIGWGCDKLFTAADLAPVRSALVAAQTRGTTSFNASGDMAGLECKGGQDWSAPPGNDDIGLDSVASLPETVDVGGTTLSTDTSGGWLAEQSWFDVPLSQGTGGGVSNLFERPEWQRDITAPGLTDGDANRRLTPDVSAVADPFTGVRIVFRQTNLLGGGTSQSAPIWAGLTAIMNQYLVENGGRPVGDLNPQLYRIAAGARLPAFRDVTLGGNAVVNAGPGYDMATGLGTPNVENLAQNLLDLQRAAP